MVEEDYREILRTTALDDGSFARMTLSKKLSDDGLPWVKVVVRPVLVKGRRAVQFSYFDPKRDVTKNYRGDEAAARLDEVLTMPFGHISLSSADGDISVRIGRKGQVQVSRGRAARANVKPDLSHDRAKARSFQTGARDEFLARIGVTNDLGEVRPAMQAKFRQINEFVRIAEQALPKGLPRGAAIRIVDCGCGSAHLTFAAFHHLRHVLGLNASVVGIDVNSELIARSSELAESLAWDGLEFTATRIADYAPDEPPVVVLSLHACDTATDEALARGVEWGSRVILAAPCCQHELNDQIKADVFRPVLRHGVLKERLADILTDAFRALLLRAAGYRTSVIEFVTPDATSKNLLIRAVKGADSGRAAALREYEMLRDYWGASPSLERLISRPGRLSS